MTEETFLLKDECYQRIGRCMRVHNELGCGFLEAIYQEALAYELNTQSIPFVKEKVLDIYIKMAYYYLKIILQILSATIH